MTTAFKYFDQTWGFASGSTLPLRADFTKWLDDSETLSSVSVASSSASLTVSGELVNTATYYDEHQKKTVAIGKAGVMTVTSSSVGSYEVTVTGTVSASKIIVLVARVEVV